MDPIDYPELERRKVTASIYALDALSAFARYRTNLPADMPEAERHQKLRKWTETASLVVCEQIDELEAYSKNDVTYADPIIAFTVNMSTLALMDIMRVMPYEAMLNYFGEYFGCQTIRDLKERHDKLCHSDDPPRIHGED